MPILRIHSFRVYNPQHESDIIRLEAVETERRSRLVYYRKNIFQTATKYSFSFTSSNKFWTKLTIICQACFHITPQKMTGLLELNFQWELFIFTLLFSSTGLWWLLVLWLQFNINEICMNVDFTVTALLLKELMRLLVLKEN